jgi:hypothetical protein
LLVAANVAGADATGQGTTVQQYVVDAMEMTSGALATKCTKSNANLQPEFNAAIANRRPRIIAALQGLLGTRQFESLSEAKAPPELVSASKLSAERSAQSNSPNDLETCTRILRDLTGQTDEQIKGMVFQMLFYTKAMIDLRTRTQGLR